jgi:ATP-dependent DNA ligase
MMTGRGVIYVMRIKSKERISQIPDGDGWQWEPLAARLVVEVEYDHFTNGRFRHGTNMLRWRPDKKPSQCTLDQLGPEKKSPLIMLDSTVSGGKR